jgi:hypothetical protein
MTELFLRAEGTTKRRSLRLPLYSASTQYLLPVSERGVVRLQ